MAQKKTKSRSNMEAKITAVKRASSSQSMAIINGQINSIDLDEEAYAKVQEIQNRSPGLRSLMTGEVAVAFNVPFSLSKPVDEAGMEALREEMHQKSVHALVDEAMRKRRQTMPHETEEERRKEIGILREVLLAAR
jgi:hypothetical protein